MLATAGLTEARYQAGAGAQRGAQRRRLRRRRRRHVLLRLRRRQGARGRRHRGRHPGAGDRSGRHAGGPQDHALGLSHRRRARPDLHRRREADEGLQLRQCDLHQRQGAGRLRLQDARDDGEEQGRPDRGPARRCATSPAAFAYKQYGGVPYHLGRDSKYFKDRQPHAESRINDRRAARTRKRPLGRSRSCGHDRHRATGAIAWPQPSPASR